MFNVRVLPLITSQPQFPRNQAGERDYQLAVLERLLHPDTRIEPHAFQ